MSKTIKTAVVGIGNCASSLVQAVVAAKQGALQSGVGNPLVGSYRIEDIEFVAAFDVDERKVGRDLGEAIVALPNCTTRYIEVPRQGVAVTPGPLLDGVAAHLATMVPVAASTATASVESVASALRASGASVVVIYLPVGATLAAQTYAHAARLAGCALVNCTPAPLANSAPIADAFRAAGLPLLGDDIKSHVGGTTLHRALLTLLKEKDIVVEDTYQLNIGGNTDFLNMRDQTRVLAKRETKADALKGLLPASAEWAVGPSDFIPHLRDFKVCYLEIRGRGILGAPVTLEVKLRVEDSPNSAAVVVDSVRAAQIALDRGLRGVIDPVCASFFKCPPRKLTDHEARQSFASFCG